jgi:hypothetical protein
MWKFKNVYNFCVEENRIWKGFDMKAKRLWVDEYCSVFDWMKVSKINIIKKQTNNRKNEIVDEIVCFSFSFFWINTCLLSSEFNNILSGIKEQFKIPSNQS